ncbi:hypothetical protein DUNSADRAFT_17388 [Dunaliella salina]|uniref:Guanylate cyclase domain-containing protein n=1 Tax=Dunaliella salina TaxID=3046 RepID=A0ABQ7G1U6_DUNSA|nr:hypothetical protein DUNSADRAFT_17388 [Dunaliella salina]|eukprot:KAF5828584.1 hypothetical protein DUNSADRAFT_17388 [Dunaliella salina]
MTQLHQEGPAPDSCAARQEHAPPQRKPSLLIECVTREAVRSEGTPAGAAAAKATAAKKRRDSAPVELSLADHRSRVDSSVRGGGRPALKWRALSSSLRQDDSSKRVQWTSPEFGLPGMSAKLSPLDQVDEGVIAISEPMQCSPQGSLQDPLMPAPVHRTVGASHPAIRKSKSSLSQQNSLPEEQEDGEEKGKEETRSHGSLSHASSSRSRRELRESRSFRCPSSRRSSILLAPEAAITQLKHGDGSEEGATRTVALLKSLSQGAKNEYSTAALPSSMKAHKGMRAAEPFVSVSMSPSTNSNCPSAGKVEGPHVLSQTIAASSTELHAYTPKSSSITRALRRVSSSAVQSLEAPLEDSSQMDSANLLTQDSCLQNGSSLYLGLCQSTSLTESPLPDEYQRQMCSEERSFSFPVEFVERALQPASEEEAEFSTKSFDVMLSTLNEDARSPLLVSIFNCTEHWQVRSTLTTLAEQQLELLSSLMPQHAIQNVKPVVEIMVFLNKLFSLFDRLTDVHRVHKIETAGDCYIVGGGIISPDQSANGFQCVMDDQDPAESAERVMEFAKALLETAKQVKMPDTNEPVRVRVGLHTGDVVSGLIGSKMPKFSIFGDTMNTASRMESTGVPGRIHVSETTQRLLPQESWESTGGVEVKGKGQMQTYLWVPPTSSKPQIQQQVHPTLVGSSADPLPCSFIKQAQQAQTLLKQLGPAPKNLEHLGRFNDEVFVSGPTMQQACCT